METQKIVDFDFKKIIPIEGSSSEKRISKIVTKKFIFLSFVIALGLGFSYQIYNTYQGNKAKEETIQKEALLIKQHEYFVIAQMNKEDILNNLDKQVNIYDDMIKDVLETNKLIPNSAQTILNQTTQIRTLSQSYKETIAQLINNMNKLTVSEEAFKNAKPEEKAMLVESVKNYQIGSLNRNNDLENMIMNYTTFDNDEKNAIEQAKPLRNELRTKIVDKINNLLGNNEITKFKKIKVKN